LDHGLTSIIIVGEMDMMKEERVAVMVLLEVVIFVCVEEMEIDEVNDREKDVGE